MASDDDDKLNPSEEETSTETSADAIVERSATEEVSVDEQDEIEATATGSLGAARYVHAAFFLAAIIGAYISSKLIVLGWGTIAEWPAAVTAVPQLVAYGEEQREGIALVIGAAIGTVMVIQSYRKEKVRRWADDVASELSRVTWPSRETTVNGTVVVIVASTIATVYVALLDRFWSFLTTLVYGV